MRNVLPGLLLLFLAGCQTPTMILQGYVGKDLREAVLDYGYPVMFLDMGDGRRAFQWDMSLTVDLPATAKTTTETQGLWTNSTTSTSKTVIDPGGLTIIPGCKYTMFGEWNAEQNGWKIIDFKKPSGFCALP